VGSPRSLYHILSVSKHEAAALYNGVEMWCERLGETVVVYANLALLTGDSQERWYFTCVNPPSGRTDYCCSLCSGDLSAFSKGRTGELRDFAQAQRAVEAARAEASVEKKVAILKRVHLHECALTCPLWQWPGNPDLFKSAPGDLLHSVLFFYKELVKQLCKKVLTAENRNILRDRMAAVNKDLPANLRLAALKDRKMWTGREGRNFGLLAPFLLRGLVEEAHLDA